jgi:hypothetical protein
MYKYKYFIPIERKLYALYSIVLLIDKSVEQNSEVVYLHS